MRALHKKKSVKAIVISGISLLLVAAIVVGVLWYLGHRSEPVKVAPVSMFMGWLSNESTQSGNVTADNLQKIYASDTQTVTALLVQEGQTVKKGDPLFRYDTTLSDIQVERQEIAVKKDDLNLNKAKKDLANINRLRPYVPTQPTDPPTEPTEPEPTDEPTQPPEPTEPTVPIAPEELPYLMGGEGTQASPLFYLCAADMQYDQSYFEELLGEKTELWVVFQVREGNALHAELLSELPLKLTRDEETQTIRFTVFVPEQDDVQTETQAAPRVSPGPDVTVVDYDGEYTAAEIAKMRAEKQKEIRDLDLKLRMDKVELERMKREAANGVVTSALDGTVLRVNDPDTAKQEGSPVIVVSGGGGYYVKTGVSAPRCASSRGSTARSTVRWRRSPIPRCPPPIIPITRPATRTSASTPCSLRSMRTARCARTSGSTSTLTLRRRPARMPCASRHASSGRMTAAAMSIAAVRISSCTSSM